MLNTYKTFAAWKSINFLFRFSFFIYFNMGGLADTDSLRCGRCREV